jgi:hypothetical protein
MLVAIRFVIVAAPARAQPAPSEPSTTDAAAANVPRSDDAEREPPDEAERKPTHELEPLPAYRDRDQDAVAEPEDARGWEEEPGTEPEDALLFGPRALLFVPNLALKIAFLPVNALAVVLERHAVVEHTIDLLYNDERTAAILPALSSQTGYGFSYGVTAFHEDLFGHDEELSAKAKYGGLYLQGYQVAFNGDHVGGSSVWIDSAVRYEHKPALLFHGIGDPPSGTGDGTLLDPRAASIATRFRQERFLGLLGAGLSVGRSPVTKLGPTAVFNHRVFGPEQRDFDEPSLETVYDTALVPGFDERLNLLELSFGVVHDSRPRKALPPSGTYFEAFAGGVVPIDEYSFFHGGVELAQHFDLYKQTRVLVLRAALEGVGGEREAIPFTELSRLGGSQTLRGYVQDRYRDRVAAVATAEYRYPIHAMLAGAVFVDVGEVGSDLGDLFNPGPFSDWKLGGGGGFILHGDDDVIVSLELAYGEAFTLLFSTDPLRAFSKRELQL